MRGREMPSSSGEQRHKSNFSFERLPNWYALSEESQHVLRLAVTETRENNHAIVTTGHLLIGQMRQEDLLSMVNVFNSKVSRFFYWYVPGNQEEQLEAARELLLTESSRSTNEGIYPQPKDKPLQLAFSQHAISLLEKTKDLVAKEGFHSDIRPIDLLTAHFVLANGISYQMLRGLVVNKENDLYPVLERRYMTVDERHINFQAFKASLA